MYSWSTAIQGIKEHCIPLDSLLKPNEYSPEYLTIIPQAWMGSDSIAHEAESRLGYRLRGHEAESSFSKIQLAGQKYRDKTTLASES